MIAATKDADGSGSLTVNKNTNMVEAFGTPSPIRNLLGRITNWESRCFVFSLAWVYPKRASMYNFRLDTTRTTTARDDKLIPPGQIKRFRLSETPVTIRNVQIFLGAEHHGTLG